MTWLSAFGLRKHIAEIFDPEIEPRADLWTYIQGWVFSRSSDEYAHEDRYQQELTRRGVSPTS
jgi:hypothetical protein